MGVVEKIPCSILSIFHGISVVIVLSLILGTWVALWQINYNEHYKGNHNDCFAGNTITTYGHDNAMYCPNTKIVSSMNITMFGKRATASIYKQPPSDIPLDGQRNWTHTEAIYIDDDDEELAWWFNINPGSYVDVTFSQIPDGSKLVLQVDDDDTYSIPPGDEGAYTVKPDPIEEYSLPSRGYKLSVTTKNSSLVTKEYYGFASFHYLQTLYGSQVAPINGSTTCSASQIFCYWEFDFGEDVCVNFYDLNLERNGQSEYAGSCIQIVQNGWNYGWNAFLIPLSCLLVILVICCNFFVSFSVSKFANRRSEIVTYSNLE